MKTLLFRLFPLLFLLGAPTGGLHAQSSAQVARPALLKGYWNLETNLTTRDYTMVRFYNDQDQLVYEERLDNLDLNLARGNGRCRRTARQLDQALQLALRDPEGAGLATAGTMLALHLQNQGRRARRAIAAR